MNNISGSAVSQLGDLIKEKETKCSEAISEVKENINLYLNVDIEQLEFIRDHLQNKYEKRREKNIFDAIISIESALVSLCN